MAIRTEQVQTEYKFDGKQALNQIGALQNEIKSLNAALNSTQKAADSTSKKMLAMTDQTTPAYRKAAKALEEYRSKASDLNTEIDQQTAKVRKLVEDEGLAALSNSKLRSYYNLLKRELDTNLIPGTDAYIAKLREVRTAEALLTARRNELKPSKSAFQSIADNLPAALAGGIAGGVVGIAGSALSAIGSAASQVIPPLKQVADQVTDLQIALNLTKEQANALNRELAQLDTRTPVEQLRLMATVAGDLNVPTDQVVGFVESINQANLAFGRDFGGNAEEVATQLGKIKGLFNETNGLSYAEAITRIGSAFKVLNDDGPATTKNIVDFVTRVGQLPVTLRPSIQNTAAFAAVLEEAGIKAEVGASGFNKLLTESIKNTPAFAKFLGLTKQQFADLINTDPNGFILKLAENLQGLSNVQVGNVLQGLGLNDAQALGVVSVFAQKLDQVTAKQTLANQSFADGNRLAQVAAEKENNLAGQLERLGKMISQVFNESGLRQGLTDMISGFINGVKEARPLLEIFAGLFRSVKGLLVSLYTLSNMLVQIGLGGRTMGDVFRFVGTVIGVVVLGIRGLNESIATVIDLLNVLFNKAKELGNFFGGNFKIDPTANFTDFYARYNKTRDQFINDAKQLAGLKVDTPAPTKPTNTTGGSPTSPTAPNGTGGFGSTDPKEADKLKDRLQRQAEIEAEYSLRRLKLYADETDKKILDANAAFEKEKARLAQDLADKIITQQQYKAAVLVANQELGQEVGKILQDNADRQNKLAEETAAKARKLASDTAIAQTEIDLAAAEGRYATARSYEEKKAALYTVLFRQNYLLFLQEEAEAFGHTEEEKYLISLKYAKKRQELADANTKALLDLSDKEKEKLNKNEEDKLKRRNQTTQEALQYAQQGIGLIFEFAAIGLQKEQTAADAAHNRRLANLDRDKEAGLLSEESYQAAKAEIEQNYNAKTRAIKRRQAEQDKIAAIFQATIQGALAVLKASPNLPLMIASGVLAAAQIAKIVATPIPEFAQGGYTDQPAAGRTQLGRKPSPTAMLAWVNEQGRERIISNAELRNPVVANLVSVIDGLRYSRTPAYATGGYTDGYRPAPSSSPTVPAADSQLQAAILEALNKINQRFDQPIEAVWQWQAFKKGYDQITDIRQNAKITN